MDEKLPPHNPGQFRGFRSDQFPNDKPSNAGLYGEADAPVMQRVFAFLLDLLGIGITSVVIFVFNIMTLGLLSPLLALLLPILFPLYHTLFVASKFSATPGMMLMGIRVEQDDGTPPSLMQSFLLVVLFYLGMSLTAGLILLVALFTKGNRCVHDILCGCTIRRKPHRVSEFSD